jgi:hypothetical protein
MMKHANRPFFFALLLALILLYGVGISRPVKNGSGPTTDCAGQCKDNYDEAVKRCNDLSGPRAERCRIGAQKQYDNCLERCRGGNSQSSERPPGL